MSELTFWTKLIKSQSQHPSLTANCTHVTGQYWIFEGDIEYLEEQGIDFVVIAEGGVPCLGDLSEAELIELCDDCYGVDLAALTKHKQEDNDQ